MRIQIIQDIIDVIRGKKEIYIELRKKERRLILPKVCKNACFQNKKQECICCFGYDNFVKIIKKNKKNLNLLGLYKNGNTYSMNISKSFKLIHDEQMKFLTENLIPIIKKEDTLCDIGCASGEFTFLFPKYCAEVEGIEYFQKYVDSANKQATELNIQNIHFYQGDIKNYKFNKKYNHILLMGVLPHIFKDKDVINIISKLHSALEDDGYLTIKSNVTDDDSRDFFDIKLNHTVEYHSKLKLEKFLKNEEFEKIKESWIKTRLRDIKELNTEVKSNHLMCIYKKV